MHYYLLLQLFINNQPVQLPGAHVFGKLMYIMAKLISSVYHSDNKD